MLAGDTELSSQRQRISLLMAKAGARASCFLASISHTAKSHRWDTNGWWWMPEHAVGCVMGEKHWAWVIFRLRSKPALCLGGRHYLIPQGSSLQIPPSVAAWTKRGRRFTFSATSQPCAGPPRPTVHCLFQQICVWLKPFPSTCKVNIDLFFSIPSHFQKYSVRPTKIIAQPSNVTTINFKNKQTNINHSVKSHVWEYTCWIIFSLKIWWELFCKVIWVLYHSLSGAWTFPCYVSSPPLSFVRHFIFW